MRVNEGWVLRCAQSRRSHARTCARVAALRRDRGAVNVRRHRVHACRVRERSTAAVESLLAAANKPVDDEIQAQAVVQSINAALGITVEGAIEEMEVVEEPVVAEVTEDPVITEETEVVDTETTETTEPVESRSISQAIEDAVVAGFLARDPGLGETEGDGTTDEPETTADASGTDDGTEGGTDDGTDGGTVTIPSS